MTWFFHVVLPVAIVVFSLWGIPSAQGTYQQRSLFGAFFLVAVVLTIGAPVVTRALDGLIGVTSVTTVLLVHLVTVGAVMCLADFVHALYSGESTWRFQRRHAVAIVLSVALTVLYLGYMPHNASALDYSQSKGRATEIVFLGVFYLWMIYVGVPATLLIVRRARQLRREHQRSVGIMLIAAGGIVEVLFACWRTAYMIVLLATGSAIINSAEVISKYLMTLALLLLIAGVVTAPVSVLLQTVQGLVVLRRLRLLWSDLTSAVPTVVLSQPPLTAWAQMRAGRVGVQVRRRAVEIRDAALTLASYAPGDLMDRAHIAVAAAGLPPSKTEIHAEALWLRAALKLSYSGAAVPATTPTQLTDNAPSDRRTEVARLIRIAAAYRRPICPDLSLPSREHAAPALSDLRQESR